MQISKGVLGFPYGGTAGEGVRESPRFYRGLNKAIFCMKGIYKRRKTKWGLYRYVCGCGESFPRRRDLLRHVLKPSFISENWVVEPRFGVIPTPPYSGGEEGGV